MKNKAALVILGALILGVGTGLVIHLTASQDVRGTMVTVFDTVTHLFLNLIKMIIAPLIFATVVGGIAGATKKAGLGRMTVRSLGWFLTASLVVGAFGFVMAHIFQVGKGLHLVDTHVTESPLKTTALTAQSFIEGIIPSSFFQAMTENKPLQILIFAVFFGLGLLALHRTTGAGKISGAIEELTAVMLKVTGYVMLFAPIGVFAAVASAFTKNGFDAFNTYGSFIGSFYASLAGLWALLVLVAVLFLGRAAFRLIKAIREPMLIGFSTSSSEAAFPKMIETLTKFGIDRKTVGFILPLGYAFNVDGSMMYMTFTSVFLVHAYDLNLDVWQQVLMCLVMLLSSKGAAGVPRSALIVVAAVAPSFGVPLAGLAVLLVVDQILDMGRTATNLLGNGIAIAVLGRKGLGHDETPVLNTAEGEGLHLPEKSLA